MVSTHGVGEHTWSEMSASLGSQTDSGSRRVLVTVLLSTQINRVPVSICESIRFGLHSFVCVCGGGGVEGGETCHSVCVLASSYPLGPFSALK